MITRCKLIRVIFLISLVYFLLLHKHWLHLIISSVNVLKIFVLFCSNNENVFLFSFFEFLFHGSDTFAM